LVSPHEPGELGVKFYVAIPAGILAYLVTLVALRLALATIIQAK
jgi:hypothetical protein